MTPNLKVREIKDWQKFQEIWEKITRECPYLPLLKSLLWEVIRIPSESSTLTAGADIKFLTERINFLLQQIQQLTENLPKEEIDSADPSEKASGKELATEALKVFLDLLVGYTSKKSQPGRNIRVLWLCYNYDKELPKKLLNILIQPQLEIINDSSCLPQVQKVIGDLQKYCESYYWPQPDRVPNLEIWKLLARAAIDLEYYHLLFEMNKISFLNEVIKQVLPFLAEKIVKKWKKKYSKLTDEEVIKKALIKGDKGACCYLQLIESLDPSALKKIFL